MEPSLEREGAGGRLKPLLKGKKGLGMFLKKKNLFEKEGIFLKKNEPAGVTRIELDDRQGDAGDHLFYIP